jgi:hypothetical protein
MNVDIQHQPGCPALLAWDVYGACRCTPTRWAECPRCRRRVRVTRNGRLFTHDVPHAPKRPLPRAFWGRCSRGGFIVAQSHLPEGHTLAPNEAEEGQR